MADLKTPYLEAGLAAFEQLDTYTSDMLLTGDYPPLKSFPMELAANVSLAQFQVCGRDGSGKIRPSVLRSPVAATGALTLTSVGSNNDTVTINGIVYTLVTALTAAYQVLIGGSATATAANLVAAINAAAGAGTTYGTGTPSHPFVTATSAAGVVTITAREVGPAGNMIAVAETSSVASWASPLLTGGVDGSTPAEFVCSQAVVSGPTTPVTVPLWFSGAFNRDILVWDATYDTDAKKNVAFVGAPAPTQITVRTRG